MRADSQKRANTTAILAHCPRTNKNTNKLDHVSQASFQNLVQTSKLTAQFKTPVVDHYLSDIGHVSSTSPSIVGYLLSTGLLHWACAREARWPRWISLLLVICLHVLSVVDCENWQIHRLSKSGMYISVLTVFRGFVGRDILIMLMLQTFQ